MEVRFYCIADCRTEHFLISNSSTIISQNVWKNCVPALFMWNGEKPNNWSFSILYYHLCTTHLLGTTPSDCFSFYMSECYIQKYQVNSKIIYTAQTIKFSIKYFFITCDQIHRKLFYQVKIPVSLAISTSIFKLFICFLLF